MSKPYWVIDLALTANEIEFICGYLSAIDFTETGDLDQPESGEELDTTFMRESIIDCMAMYSRIACYLSDNQTEDAGADFWLTRQGHGSGFWDNGDIYGEANAQRFTIQAESFGEVYPVFENFCPLH